MPSRSLTIQTASLYASGFTSQFAGTGGPWGYDTFTDAFAGVVSSAGLAGEPFADRAWNVDAGDYITFVVAVQNLSAAKAYGILLRDAMPAGFAAPAEGAGLTVTDGAGNLLATTGDLFDPAGGLQLTAPLAAYDANSGANIALLTFTLQAADTLPVPAATLPNAARIVRFAASAGGPDISGTAPAADLQASTTVTTSEPTLESRPDQDLITLATGQQAAFDVALTLPEGQTDGLRITELLPRSGSAWLDLVSAEIIHIGRNLTVQNPATIQPDGTLDLGTVVNTPDDTTDYDDEIVLRLTVQPGGSSSGVGTLTTVATMTDPNGAGTPYSTSIDNTLQVAPGDVAPVIQGTSFAQHATTTMLARPFAQVSMTDPDPGQVETLTIQITNRTLGSLAGTAGGIYDPAAGTFTAHGSIATVQAAARALTFVPTAGQTGTEGFVITLDDGAGGVTTDSTSGLTIAAPAIDASAVQHFAASTAATVATTATDGAPTVSQAESYGGPVGYLQSQFVYDGPSAATIAPQTPNMFVKSLAGSVTVALQSGQNVVDPGPGTNVLTSGTGNDTFFLNALAPGTAWDTIINFHAGDMMTIWGYRPGTSSYTWEDNAGTPGLTGRTLHLDVTGSGHGEQTITFAGTTAADTAHYALTTGIVGGVNYMAVFSL